MAPVTQMKCCFTRTAMRFSVLINNSVCKCSAVYNFFSSNRFVLVCFQVSQWVFPDQTLASKRPIWFCLMTILRPLSLASKKVGLQCTYNSWLDGYFTELMATLVTSKNSKHLTVLSKLLYCFFNFSFLFCVYSVWHVLCICKINICMYILTTNIHVYSPLRQQYK